MSKHSKIMPSYDSSDLEERIAWLWTRHPRKNQAPAESLREVKRQLRDVRTPLLAKRLKSLAVTVERATTTVKTNQGSYTAAEEISAPSPWERVAQDIEQFMHDILVPLFAEVLQRRDGSPVLRLQHYDRLDAMTEAEQLFIDSAVALVAEKHELAVFNLRNPLEYELGLATLGRHN